MAEMVGYEDKPDVGGGKFLNLNAKGDKVTIRLLSQPITYFVHWVENKSYICEDKESCEHCLWFNSLPEAEKKKKENAQKKRRQTYIWPVVDRADGEVKIFKGGVSIFLGIRQFALDPKWGGKGHDATNFDITVTRTEESLQNFYSVVPDPTSLMVDITDKEITEMGKLGPLMDQISTGQVEEGEFKLKKGVKGVEGEDGEDVID